LARRNQNPWVISNKSIIEYSMTAPSELPALHAFHHAAKRVPAYRQFLVEAGVAPEEVTTYEQFIQLPLLDKNNTFCRFPIEELCVDGELGQLGSVLTSSGQSGGAFAFGLNDSATQPAAVEWTDNVLDMVFSVRSRKSLLINCLPMGVKVNTNACTLAETSVRPDMAIALVKAFKNHYEQFIIVGDPGFVKHLFELGQETGVEWPKLLVHVILGEETLPENARSYFYDILGIDPDQSGDGVVASSMGIGELGLNLFFEAPCTAPLIRLRRLLHQDADLRQAALGSIEFMPTLFTFDPRRLFVEFDSGNRLILTTLDPYARLPLIRYLTGDSGSWLRLPEDVRTRIEGAGISWNTLQSTPIVMIQGREKYATAGEERIYPEAVKEGIYFDKTLARKTTANFRIVAGKDAALIRIQLSLGVEAEPRLPIEFAAAISQYVRAPFKVSCEPYSVFGSGMSLDYERKFDYLGR
jgi:phenylacetate-CoA ligase